MNRLQEKIRYQDFLYDILEDAVEAMNVSSSYLTIDANSDIYDAKWTTDMGEASKRVGKGCDLWNICKHEPLDLVVAEIATHYFNVR